MFESSCSNMTLVTLPRWEIWRHTPNMGQIWSHEASKSTTPFVQSCEYLQIMTSEVVDFNLICTLKNNRNSDIFALRYNVVESFIAECFQNACFHHQMTHFAQCCLVAISENCHASSKTPPLKCCFPIHLTRFFVELEYRTYWWAACVSKMKRKKSSPRWLTAVSRVFVTSHININRNSATQCDFWTRMKCRTEVPVDFALSALFAFRKGQAAVFEGQWTVWEKWFVFVLW